LGSRGWPEGVQQMGHHRAINREKLERDALERELADISSRRRMIFERYAQLLRARSAHPAFYPFGEMRVLDVDEAVFAVLRDDRVLCLHNVSGQPRAVRLNPAQIGSTRRWVDLVSGQSMDVSLTSSLSPYQTLWLACASKAD
jgi:sucrose phosphorylase